MASASIIVNAINENFENPDKVTFVARAIRLLACLTQSMENAMAIGKVPDANLHQVAQFDWKGE